MLAQRRDRSPPEKQREWHPNQQGVQFLFKCGFILVNMNLKSLFFSFFVCSTFLKVYNFRFTVAWITEESPAQGTK